MINTSNEYKERILNDRRFYLSAMINVNNEIIELNDKDIMQGGMEFEDATSGDSSFQIGAAIINKHTLTIDNKTGEFDEYDFTGATIVPFVGLQLSQTIERLKKGFYTVDESKFIGNIITLECLDNMHKFERSFKDVNVGFPITVSSLLNILCTHCGVYLATSTFTNSTFMIEERPIDDALTCLDMVSYIAQIGGNFARCNIDGALEIKWYDMTAFEQSDSLDGGYYDDSNPYHTGDNADGGNFTNYNSGSSVDGGTFLQSDKFIHVFNFGSSPTIAIDDVVITGIKVENTDSENGYSVLVGTEGYILNIVNNPLIQSESQAQSIANIVGAKIIGMIFRPFSASILSDPSIESSDPIKLSVRSIRGFDTYQSYITNLSYRVNSREQISNNAETPSRNSSKRYSAETKAIIEARKQMDNKLSSYDLSMQHLTSLITNSFGVFKTQQTLEDGSTIYFLHDKPTLAESLKIWKMTADAFAVSTDGGKTWNAGIDASGNAVVNVLSAIGVNADWVRTGKLQSYDNSVVIDLENGNFSFSDSNGKALITPNGVANSDNFQAVDNITNNYPLKMPFFIDDNVSVITSVKLNWTIDKFRTYSTGTSGGGGGSTTSDSATSWTEVSTTPLSKAGYTNDAVGPGSHSHYFSLDATHSHVASSSPHSHNVYFGSHSHGVSYGILETNVTDTIIKVLVDGVERATLTTSQGEINLSQWITTPGWHTIEITSASLKRVSAQVNIKSYIRR